MGWLSRIFFESLIRVSAMAYRLSPRALQQRLGSLLGWILKKAAYRRAIVLENLNRAFGHADPDQVARAYSHFGELLAELFLLGGGLKGFVARWGKIEGMEHWIKAQAQGRGVIVLASHIGNWELMSATGARAGIPIMIVTKQLKPEWLHRLIEKTRRRAGVLGTYEPKTLRSGYAHLKSGGTLGFVLDQFAGPPVGIRVPFFGTMVGTPAIVAVLAKRSGAPVVPVVSYRSKDGAYRLRFGAPLPWLTDQDPSREIALNTAAYAAKIEKYIREYPDQWLWVHRRFKGDLGPLAPDEWSRARTRSAPPRLDNAERIS